MHSKKLVRWFGTAALVAGLFAVAPITANAADGVKPQPKPPAGPTCTGWEGKINTVTAAEPGQITVTGTVQAEAGSDGGACLAKAQLIAFEGQNRGQWTWFRTGRSSYFQVPDLGAYSVTIPVTTHPLCVSSSEAEALDCVIVAPTDAGTSPGTPYRVWPKLLPADQTGNWDEPDPNCGTCV